MGELNAVPHPGAASLDGWVQRWLRQTPRGPLAVAYSAGADSTALLAAACLRWPGGVVALHVHHGLQTAADEFESTARRVCLVLDVGFKVGHVNARAQPGQSPEDAARVARYQALADMSRKEGACAVLLGQHADDQLETLWLALGRGAGLPGLAGMSERFERHGVLFGRPFLNVPGQALRQWVQSSGLPFVDDPSNQDLRFTRNRVRAQLAPAWNACFPGHRETVMRSMRHMAQAQALLEELGHDDLAAVGVPPRIDGLQSLSRPRQANALRLWLRQAEGVAPSEAQLVELLDQVHACRTRGHGLRIKVATGFVLRDRDRLVYRSR